MNVALVAQRRMPDGTINARPIIAMTVGILVGVLNKATGFNIAAQMMSYFAAGWVVKTLFNVG